MPGSGVSPLLEILPKRGPQDLNWVGEGFLPWLGGIHYLARVTNTGCGTFVQ